MFMLIRASEFPLPFLLVCDEDQCSEFLILQTNENQILLFH